MDKIDEATMNDIIHLIWKAAHEMQPVTTSGRTDLPEGQYNLTVRLDGPGGKTILAITVGMEQKVESMLRRTMSFDYRSILNDD